MQIPGVVAVAVATSFPGLMALRARALDLGIELEHEMPAPIGWPRHVSYIDRATVRGLVFNVGGVDVDEHARALAELVVLVIGARDDAAARRRARARRLRRP